VQSAYDTRDSEHCDQLSARAETARGELLVARNPPCRYTERGFCEGYHAADEPYWKNVHYWNTPIAQCLDGRTDVKCVDYSQWKQSWTGIRG